MIGLGQVSDLLKSRTIYTIGELHCDRRSHWIALDVGARSRFFVLLDNTAVLISLPNVEHLEQEIHDDHSR